MPPSDYVPKLYEVPPEPGAPLRPHTVAATAPSADTLVPTNPLPLTFADLAVLLIGVALLVWALTAELPLIVLVLASAITVVGVLLPLRKLARRPAAAVTSTHTANGHAPDQPLLLDLADPTTARLGGAYRSLATAVAGQDGPFAEAALVAGHRTLVEAADLVQGRPPAGLDELDQLDQRSTAMGALTAAIRAHPDPLPLPPAPVDGSDALPALGDLHAALTAAS